MIYYNTIYYDIPTYIIIYSNILYHEYIVLLSPTSSMLPMSLCYCYLQPLSPTAPIHGLLSTSVICNNPQACILFQSFPEVTAILGPIQYYNVHAAPDYRTNKSTICASSEQYCKYKTPSPNDRQHFVVRYATRVPAATPIIILHKTLRLILTTSLLDTIYTFTNTKCHSLLYASTDYRYLVYSMLYII